MAEDMIKEYRSEADKIKGLLRPDANKEQQMRQKFAQGLSIRNDLTVKEFLRNEKKSNPRFNLIASFNIKERIDKDYEIFQSLFAEEPDKVPLLETL